MTTMSKTERDLDLLILEDLEFETPCVGLTHAESARGHQADQAATHYLKCPDCHRVSLICAGRATYLRTSTRDVKCSGDGFTAPAPEWEVGRIPGK